MPVGNSNIFVEGIEGITLTGVRDRAPLGLNLNAFDNLPVPAAPSVGTVTDAINVGRTAEEIRGGQILADVYTNHILDSFAAEAELAAETALRAGANADDVARQLANYDIEGLRLGAERAFRAVEAAANRIASAAAARLPTYAVTAARVVSGTPLGLAMGIVEGAYHVGSYLSDLAYRAALERIGPPPARPRPPAVATEPDDEPLPDFVIPGVTVSNPRPQPNPVTVAPPQFFQPFPMPTGSPFDTPFDAPQPAPQPRPTPAPVLTPLDFVSPGTPPFSSPAPTPGRPGPRTGSPTVVPLLLATPLAVPGFSPMPSPGSGGSPTSPNDPQSRNCRCDQKKKKQQKKKAREICYRGEYVEKSKGLIKFKKRKVPCQ